MVGLIHWVQMVPSQYASNCGQGNSERGTGLGFLSDRVGQSSPLLSLRTAHTGIEAGCEVKTVSIPVIFLFPVSRNRTSLGRG